MVPHGTWHRHPRAPAASSAMCRGGSLAGTSAGHTYTHYTTPVTMRRPTPAHALVCPHKCMSPTGNAAAYICAPPAAATPVHPAQSTWPSTRQAMMKESMATRACSLQSLKSLRFTCAGMMRTRKTGGTSGCSGSCTANNAAPRAYLCGMHRRGQTVHACIQSARCRTVGHVATMV